MGISLQQALDFRSEGRLTEALQQYQNVLTLDPTNAATQEGMQALLAMAQGTDAAAAATGIPHAKPHHARDHVRSSVG